MKAKQLNGALAKIRKICPVTLPCFNRRFLRIGILPILKLCLVHGLAMLGEANMGKTPVALALCFLMSRYYIIAFNLDQDPQMRQASDLDFFRGDPGSIFQPFLLDDSNLAMQAIEKLKAFLDVSEEEAMTYQRWGASKFVRNQFRVANANAYDEGVERDLPIMYPTDEFDNIAKDKFYNLIEPALMKNTSKPDVDALLKRATFIVVSKNFIYVKRAAQEEVIRFRNVEQNLLTDEGGLRYYQWKTNGTMPDASLLRAEIDVEQRMMARLVMGRPAEPPRWQRGSLNPN